MEHKIINYASTSKSSKNIVEADGFQLKGGGIIGMSSDPREVKVISYASTVKSAKNIIEADGFLLKGVGMIGEGSPSPSIPKHPYVAKQRVKADMNDSQKQGIAVWNSLIQTLQDAGLMEDKD